MSDDYGASHDFAKSREKWLREHSQNISGRPNVSEKDEKKEYGEVISFRADKTYLAKLEYFRDSFRNVYSDENWDENGKLIRKVIDNYYSLLEALRKQNGN